MRTEELCYICQVCFIKSHPAFNIAIISIARWICGRPQLQPHVPRPLPWHGLPKTTPWVCKSNIICSNKVTKFQNHDNNFPCVAALKGVCGWPIDRQETSKRDCEVVGFKILFFFGQFWVILPDIGHICCSITFSKVNYAFNKLDSEKMIIDRQRNFFKVTPDLEICEICELETSSRLQSTSSQTRAWSRRSPRMPRWPGPIRSAGYHSPSFQC